MTASEAMRDRILRVLVAESVTCGHEWCEGGAPDDCFYCEGVYESLADALLAAFPFLAGVTDEMVVTFKRAWHEADERGRTGDRVRAGLTAVLGASRRSRDADAPGDGSSEHDRDGVGICKLCGEGLSGATIVDGETTCGGAHGRV